MESSVLGVLCCSRYQYEGYVRTKKHGRRERSILYLRAFTLEWCLLLCASVCKQKHSYVRQWIVQEFMLLESFHTELLAILPLLASLRVLCEWTLNINGLENVVCAFFARRFRATVPQTGSFWMNSYWWLVDIWNIQILMKYSHSFILANIRLSPVCKYSFKHLSKAGHKVNEIRYCTDFCEWN